ncbi:MAG: hypothetical protein ACYC3A_08305 [Halothiobacillus sp.]
MEYNLPGLTIEQITNLYLFGQPSTLAGLADELLIRPPEVVDLVGDKRNIRAQTIVHLDAVSFMANGPGRYAAASMSNVVKDFMQGGIMPATGARQEITVAQWFDISGKSPSDRFLSFQQYNYGGSSGDFASRVYIYNSSSFAIPLDAKFVVEADGTRSIENFAILPANDNFDFISDDFATGLVNPILDHQIDPL